MIATFDTSEIFREGREEGREGRKCVCVCVCVCVCKRETDGDRDRQTVQEWGQGSYGDLMTTPPSS